jgi:hypothetical protein
MQNYLHGLGREFGLPLIDARTWVPDEEFRDAHHLLCPGAERFTDRLGKEALLPMLLHTSQGDHFARK